VSLQFLLTYGPLNLAFLIIIIIIIILGTFVTVLPVHFLSTTAMVAQTRAGKLLGVIGTDIPLKEITRMTPPYKVCCKIHQLSATVYIRN